MKKIIIIVLGIFIFFLILLAVTYLESFKNNGTNPVEPIPTPAKVNIPQTKSIVGAKKLLQNIQQRPTPILGNDKSARDKLITLTDSLGTINTTHSYILTYTKSSDTFEVEILSTDYKNAILEATNFLKNEGLSEDGICKLPVIFYLNYEVKKELNGLTINPMPDFCL